MAKLLIKSAMPLLGAAIIVGGFTIDGEPGSLVPAAEARVGRPATPDSYAGVARRTTRRAVVATGAAAQPVVVAAPTTVVVATPTTTQTCVDTVTPDGTITRTCR